MRGRSGRPARKPSPCRRHPVECYLDNSATTAVSPEAAALALHIMTEEYGNPSSLHRRGFLAERAMTEARGQVAAVLHCRPEEIIFTAGGSPI